MLSFTTAQLDSWITAFFWPFFRILALVAAAPVLGARGVPASVKVGLAFVLTLMVAPLLGAMPDFQPASATGLMILAQQLMIGYAMGLAMRIVFSAMEMAGYVAGLQMGLGFATFFDPQNSAQVPVLGQFLSLIATLLFLAMNGHLLVVSALIESFEVLPIGLHGFSNQSWRTLALWGGEIFRTGLLIALPVIAVLIMANLALAVLTRAAPQLNIFVVGFPLTLGLGFIALAYSLNYLLPVFSTMVESGVEIMLRLAKDANIPASF